MNWKQPRFIFWSVILTLILISAVGELWPKVFPQTEIVVINATEQELRNVVVEMPGESVSFDSIPAGDYALMRVRRRMPEPDFVPTQRGTMADGTSIQPHGLSAGEGVPFKRVVYTVRPDGTLYASLSAGGNWEPNQW